MSQDNNRVSDILKGCPTIAEAISKTADGKKTDALMKLLMDAAESDISAQHQALDKFRRIHNGGIGTTIQTGKTAREIAKYGSPEAKEVQRQSRRDQRPQPVGRNDAPPPKNGKRNK